MTALPNISDQLDAGIKEEILKQIILARQNPQYSGRIAERKDQIKSLYDAIAPDVSTARFRSYDDITDQP